MGDRNTTTRRCAACAGLAERELDQRWARNTMLNKWLEYCIDRGHGFRVLTIRTPLPRRGL